MKSRHRMQNHHVGAGGLSRDPWMRIAEARLVQAEAIAGGRHRVRTGAGRAVAGSQHHRLPASTPVPDGSKIRTVFVARRYSLGLAIAERVSRGILRLVRLIRDSVLESLARRSRRSKDMERLAAMDDRLLADVGLRRSEIATMALIGRRGPCHAAAEPRHAVR